MSVTVKFDDGAFGDFLRDFPKDARKAGLHALNEAAKVGQKALQSEMAGTFTFRSLSARRFMERQVKIDFYKAGGPEQVRLHSAGPNDEPSRQLLPKFSTEVGGTKTGRDGGSLAVPVMARPTKGAAVPARYRLSKLGLKPGLNGNLISTTDRRVWADRQSVKRRVGRGKSATVVVLYTWRKQTRTPRPMGWGRAGEKAIAAWPAIAEKALMEKAAHLLKRGRATAQDFGFR
jgi:hypothetical protein